jgi:hypothetical protein
LLIGGKDHFLAIRAYIDRSGQASSKFVSLAAFVATDDVWAKFESGWNRILKTASSSLTYMHMKEAMQRRAGTPFSRLKGWDQSSAWALVFELAKFMGSFLNTELLNFSCVVDMNDWRKVRAEGVNIPSEIALCNTYVPRCALTAAARSILNGNESTCGDIFLDSDELIYFIFDRNEPFFEPFRAEWKAEKDKAKASMVSSPWLLVGSVEERDMKATPGIQAADILAWALNRENTTPEGFYGTRLAEILRNITAGASMTIDENVLREISRTCTEQDTSKPVPKKS